MKKILAILVVTLMSVMASTPVSAKTGKKDFVTLVPANIIVKQTTKFNDGRTLTIYYKKSGTQCEVYSPCDESKYNLEDASKIQSTNFEVVNNVEGKLYRKATVKEIAIIVKYIVSQFL